MTWEYIAGFTDGEGYILNRHYTTKEYSKNVGKWYTTTRHRRRIVLTQSDKQCKVLYDIGEFLDKELNTSIKIYNRKDGNHQLMIIRDADTKAVAEKILPFSIVKRRVLTDLLATYENPELLENPNA